MLETVQGAFALARVTQTTSPFPVRGCEKLFVVFVEVFFQSFSLKEKREKYNTVQWITWLGGR